MTGLRLDLVEGRCYPVKGDGLVTVYEICDDNNLDSFDYCLSYEFSCADNCKECVRGICLSCKTGWRYNQVH